MGVKRTCLLHKNELKPVFLAWGVYVGGGGRLTEESSLPDSKVGIFKSPWFSSVPYFNL